MSSLHRVLPLLLLVACWAAIPEDAGANETEVEKKHTAADEMSVSANSAKDVQAFISAVLLNGAICAGCVAALMVLIRMFPRVYMNNVAIGNAPSKPNPNFFAWVKASWCVTTEEAIKHAGLDSAMLLEFCSLCMRLSAVLAVPLVVVMCPLNYFCGGGMAGDDKLSSVDMGNVENGSWLFYLYAFVVWGVALVLRHFLHRAQAQFLQWRFAWLKALPYPRSNTILIEGIPMGYRTDERLRQFMSGIFSPDAIAEVHVVKKTATLAAAVKRKQDLEHIIEREHLRLEKTGERPEVRKNVCGKKEDSIRYHEEQLDQVNTVLEGEKARIAHESVSESPGVLRNLFSHAGFVTFRSRIHCEMALDLNYCADKHKWLTFSPPEASSMRWGDLVTEAWMKKGSVLIGYAAVCALYIFFIPICGVLTTYAKKVDAGPAQSVWDGIAPTFGLQVMLAFLPSIMLAIFRIFFSLKSDPESQHQLQIWYFLFQLFFVILVTAVGASLWDQFKNISKDPSSIFSLLATKLPSATHFYMNYIVLQCATHAIAALRVANCAKFILYRTLYDEDMAKELAEPEDQDYSGMGSRYTRFAIVMVITLVYATLSPLIAVLSCLHFAFARLMYGYLVVYAEGKKPDLGGNFWVTALKHLIGGGVIFSALMLGVFSARAPWGAFVIAAPCFVFMLLMYREFCNSFHWERLPFDEMSAAEAETSEAPSEATVDEESYVQPEMLYIQRIERGADLKKAATAANSIQSASFLSDRDTE